MTSFIIDLLELLISKNYFLSFYFGFEKKINYFAYLKDLEKFGGLFINLKCQSIKKSSDLYFEKTDNAKMYIELLFKYWLEGISKYFDFKSCTV